MGITEPTESAQYVCFRGPVKELPKGEDGSYGTSIPMHMALDPAADVLIAYEQNGARLSVDHGFPVRVIIPGWIGGRMIKWLCEIKVSSTPSDNFYVRPGCILRARCRVSDAPLRAALQRQPHLAARD